MLAVVAALALMSPALPPGAPLFARPASVLAHASAPSSVAAPLGRAAVRQPRQIVIELTERRPGATPVVERYELGLAPDGSPSRLETDDGPTHTRLVARQQLHDTAESTLTLEVERERRGERGQPSDRATFAMQAVVAHGKRVLLGRAARGSGAAFEVAVTLQ